MSSRSKKEIMIPIRCAAGLLDVSEGTICDLLKEGALEAREAPAKPDRRRWVTWRSLVAYVAAIRKKYRLEEGAASGPAIAEVPCISTEKGDSRG